MICSFHNVRIIEIGNGGLERDSLWKVKGEWACDSLDCNTRIFFFKFKKKKNEVAVEAPV